MSQLFKHAVISTLRDPKMVQVNLQYGPSRVYPSGYLDVARLVEDGHIYFERTTGNASYEVDAPPGTAHRWRVPADMAVDDGSGRLIVNGTLSANGRGNIVHEATHALQDFQRLSATLGNSFTPQMAEGSAYVASWVARLQWGYGRLSHGVNPRMSSHAFSRSLAGRLLDGNIVYRIPPGDVRILNSMVLTGGHDHYVFNGI